MKIGVPREIKVDEYRVAIVPAGVQALVKAGHTVAIETGAGEGSAIADEAYVAAGAKIAARREDIFAVLAKEIVNDVQPKLAEPGVGLGDVQNVNREGPVRATDTGPGRQPFGPA